MALDFGLAADGCIFFIPGASPNFWLSNDVQHVAPPPAGSATPGVINDLRLEVRRQANCAIVDDVANVKIDLYVCDPNAGPMNTNTPGVRKITDALTGSINVPLGSGLNELGEGGSFVRTVKWSLPPASTHLALQPGHKCLIARAYPATATLTPGEALGEYAGSLDPHYAQRNICILPCSSPCAQSIVAARPDEEAPPETTFFAFADLNPTGIVKETVLPLLMEAGGFKQFATRPPKFGFSLGLEKLRVLKVMDNSQPAQPDGTQIFWGEHPVGEPLVMPEFGDGLPFFHAIASLPPGLDERYTFETDLEGAEPGDAHIFHVIEVENTEILGGLTIVLMKE